MYLKWINCKVPEENRPAFNTAQRAWGFLSKVDGFMGQVGGWSQDDRNLACILGVWKHRAAHERFMGHTHDSITSVSGQDELYESSVIEFLDLMYVIPGISDSPMRDLESAQVLRVVTCRVHFNRQAHFVQMQQEIRNPGLAKQEGFVGGLFGRSDSEPDRFCSIMGWRDRETYEAFESKGLLTLREESKADSDIRSQEIFRIALDPTWFVPSGA